MYIRYKNNRIIQNDNEVYKPLFDERGLKFITHLSMGGLKYPTQEEIDAFILNKEEWKIGDALWKYAAKYYEGRGHFWWVIAHFNQKPTDQHYTIGDIVYIPQPLDKVLRSYGL